jgi:hypothetical protein
MAAKPVVDRLKEDWKTGQILRVDVLTPVGREFANQHGFEGTPTFVLFDGAENEASRWRGQPPALNELPNDH